MAAAKAPAFMFYPDKWTAGTIHLSDKAYRAYHRLLCWMWLHGIGHFRMPDTDSAWERATGTKGAVMRNVRAEIMDDEHKMLSKRTYKDAPFLFSLGLQKEAKKQTKYRKKQRDNAKARWDKGVKS